MFANCNSSFRPLWSKKSASKSDNRWYKLASRLKATSLLYLLIAVAMSQYSLFLRFYDSTSENDTSNEESSSRTWKWQFHWLIRFQIRRKKVLIVSALLRQHKQKRRVKREARLDLQPTSLYLASQKASAHDFCVSSTTVCRSSLIFRIDYCHFFIAQLCGTRFCRVSSFLGQDFHYQIRRHPLDSSQSSFLLLAALYSVCFVLRDVAVPWIVMFSGRRIRLVARSYEIIARSCWWISVSFCEQNIVGIVSLICSKWRPFRSCKDANCSLRLSMRTITRVLDDPCQREKWMNDWLIEPHGISFLSFFQTITWSAAKRMPQS